jgi:hypothetical protein
MDDRERALIGKWYELQASLYEHQGREIEALKRANRANGEMIEAFDDAFTSLKHAHEILGQMMILSRDLVRPS